jgi:hypothetical protein
MRLSIKAGGLQTFFSRMDSFLSNAQSDASGKALIKSLQNVTSRTNSLKGGVSPLGIALGHMNDRILLEERRRTAVTNVRRNANRFVQTAIDVDKNVAKLVKAERRTFFRNHPEFKPPSWWQERWNNFTDWAKSALNRIVEFTKKHWKKVIVALAVVATIALAVLTGGASLIMKAAIKAAIAAKAFILKNIKGALIGMLFGVAGQFLNDLISGKGFSSWQTYVGAAIGGAIGGMIMFGGGASVGAAKKVIGSAVDGFISSIVGGLLEKKPISEVWRDSLIKGGLGAITAVAFIPFPKPFSQLPLSDFTKSIVLQTFQKDIFLATIKRILRPTPVYAPTV